MPNLDWEARYDGNSRRYFYINHVTKQTQWKDPRQVIFEQRQQQQQQPQRQQQAYQPQMPSSSSVRCYFVFSITFLFSSDQFLICNCARSYQVFWCDQFLICKALSGWNCPWSGCKKTGRATTCSSSGPGKAEGRSEKTGWGCSKEASSGGDAETGAW